MKRLTNTRKLTLESLECRLVLAASLGWDGPGQGSAQLTYFIANHPSSLTQAQTNTAIETALSAWSKAATVTFTPTTRPNLTDSIDISFVNLDGPGGTLAQAYFPDDVNPARIAGDIQFDLADVWEVGNALGNRAFDLVWIAVHELGHSLGLDHTNSVSSVLAPYVSPSQSFTKLSNGDVAAIQQVYATAPGATIVSTTTMETTIPSTGSTDTVNPTDTGDSDTNPFPRTRWRRGGNWHRFGGRLDSDTPENHNLYLPTDVNGDNSTTAGDALVVINQLNRMLGDGDTTIVGMCDTNGDGTITAGDALMVINALVINSIDADGTNTIDGLDDTNIMDDTVDVVDDTNTIDNTTDTVDDTTNTVDPTDPLPTDTVDDTTPTNTVDDGTSPTDTDDDATPADDDEDCRGTGQGHRDVFRIHWHGLLSPESLITRFDTNSDQALSEAELPDRIWQEIVDANVDTDGDELVTIAELEVVVQAMISEKFSNLDRNSDGLITQDDVTIRIWERFSGADSDSDGGVSLEELTTFLQQNVDTDDSHTHHFHPHGLVSPDALMARFDDNGDLALSEDELPERLWQKFVDEDVDTDSDGLVTGAELEAAIQAKISERFTDLDTNTDGVLTQDEVHDRIWAKFSSADTDANGEVSLEELTTFLRENSDIENENGPNHRHHRGSSHLDRVNASLSQTRTFSQFRIRTS